MKKFLFVYSYTAYEDGCFRPIQKEKIIEESRVDKAIHSFLNMVENIHEYDVFELAKPVYSSDFNNHIKT